MKGRKTSAKKSVDPTDSEIQHLIEQTKKQYEKYQEINSSLNFPHQSGSENLHLRTLDHPLTISFKSN